MSTKPVWWVHLVTDRDAEFRYPIRARTSVAAHAAANKHFQDCWVLHVDECVDEGLLGDYVDVLEV